MADRTEAYAFAHDPQRCIKCYTCEIACKQWRGIAPGTAGLRRVSEVATGTFPHVKRTFHSVACMHCADAPCIPACPPGAIRKNEDGVIMVEVAKCDGCRKCLDACPFGAPQFDASGTLLLCDLCADRLAEGKSPICASSCPTQALRWNASAAGL
jgi:anaerobic dimethyl sulfoxide reductase subunit B (iron-sulfur subunit)